MEALAQTSQKEESPSYDSPEVPHVQPLNISPTHVQQPRVSPNVFDDQFSPRKEYLAQQALYAKPKPKYDDFLLIIITNFYLYHSGLS